MFRNVKPGQTLYSLIHGEITVKANCQSDNFPLKVIDSDGSNFAYTNEGYYWKDRHRCFLYWAKPEIIPPPKPKVFVDKAVTVFANVYPDGRAACVHTTEDAARDSAGPRAVAVAVPCIGKFRVEEE